MEDNYQGDLTDIDQANRGIISPTTTTTTTTDDQMRDWQFGPSNTDQYPFPDQLQNQMDLLTSTGLPFLGMGGFSWDSGPVPGPAQTDSNSALFSRAIQISSDGCNNNSNNNSNNDNNNNNYIKFPVIGASPRVVKSGYGLMSSEMSINESGNNFIDGTTGVQVPSPRNPGIKRRKSQAKKVVCIPAPAPANSRQSGEVVPSDLWAWRKYGQKPIKGSPYPRGYYRCSSSKGCSARKQVERSRTDPNMLVITYASEHNHPWPTQRNVLAGSTRSQPTKTTSSKPSPLNINPQTQTTTTSTNNNVPVKEEDKDHIVEDNKGVDHDHNHDQEDTLSPSYRPVMYETNGHDHQQPAAAADQDFFADLVGFEGDDPLNLLFTQESKGLDPLFGGLYHWGSPNSSIDTKEDDPNNTFSTSNEHGEKSES